MTAAAGDLSSRSAGTRAVAVNPWLIAVVVSMATFMEVLDTSIANVALPHIAGGLAAGPDESTWVLTSYLVSNAIVLPISGWLASIIGRKRFYMGCVALFTISSLLCGLAPSLQMLIFFRVLQGIGGGGLAPSEQAILNDTFHPRQRGMAFALYGVAIVVAPAIGPTLGGWITDSYSWRWIFFINVPVGLLSLLLTHLLVEDPPDLQRARQKRLKQPLNVDFVGFALIAIGLGSLQVVLDKGQRDDWFGSHFIIFFSCAGAIGIIAAIFWELWRPDPIVDLPLMKDRTFLISNLIMFIVGFVLFGSTVLIPEMAQELFGYTAEKAGLLITPGGFAVMALMPVVGFLTSRVAARWLILVGLIVSAVSCYHLGHLSLNADYWTLARARIYQASGIAFLFVPINTAAYAGLPRDKSNNASALLNLFRNLGGSVGISVVTTMLARREQVHQVFLVSHLNPFNPIYVAALANTAHTLQQQGVLAAQATQQARGILMQEVARQEGILSYNDAFLLLAVSAVCMIPTVFLLKNNKPGKGGAAMH
jgi:DHA2 family multidrug resistance protein